MLGEEGMLGLKYNLFSSKCISNISVFYRIKLHDFKLRMGDPVTRH